MAALIGSNKGNMAVSITKMVSNRDVQYFVTSAWSSETMPATISE